MINNPQGDWALQHNNIFNTHNNNQQPQQKWQWLITTSKVIEHYNTGNELPGAPSGQTKVASFIHSFIHSFMGMRMIICLSSVVMLILFGMMLLIIIHNSICASLIIHTPGAHLCKGPQIEFQSCFNMRKLFRKSRKKFRTSWKCVFKFYDYENANTLEEWKLLQNLFGAKLKLLISNK